MKVKYTIAKANTKNFVKSPEIFDYSPKNKSIWQDVTVAAVVADGEQNISGIIPSHVGVLDSKKK